jgi:formylglycine-generating enzyme required for sulfatase activity
MKLPRMVCWMMIFSLSLLCLALAAQDTPQPKPKPKPKVTEPTTPPKTTTRRKTPVKRPRTTTEKPTTPAPVTPAPVETKPAPAVEMAGPGSLLLVIDMDCRITLDGKDLGVFKEDESRAIRVVLGQHLLKAVSMDKQYKWENELTVENSKQVIVRIPLARVKAEAEEAVRREAAAKAKAEADAREAERQRIAALEAQRIAEANVKARAIAEENARKEAAAKLEKAKKEALDALSSGNLFVKVPAGEFMMGDNDNNPIHRVKISQGFELGKYEVTQALWEVVMGSNPSYFKGATLPVENVSWEDVQQFLSRLNAQDTRYQYRLPTEAEWEYACRAGTTGDYAGSLYEMAWYGDNSGGKTHPVGEKKPNAWGLYDMHGNVWEWCADWYGNYQKGVVTDPRGPSTGSYRVYRGGGWGNPAAHCRSANRRSNSPGYRTYNLGFRLVRLVR